jgi:hypothetical protein
MENSATGLTHFSPDTAGPMPGDRIAHRVTR